MLLESSQSNSLTNLFFRIHKTSKITHFLLRIIKIIRSQDIMVNILTFC